jgi:hypothetical protein
MSGTIHLGDLEGIPKWDTLAASIRETEDFEAVPMPPDTYWLTSNYKGEVGHFVAVLAEILPKASYPGRFYLVGEVYIRSCLIASDKTTDTWRSPRFAEFGIGGRIVLNPDIMRKCNPWMVFRVNKDTETRWVTLEANPEQWVHTLIHKSDQGLISAAEISASFDKWHSDSMPSRILEAHEPKSLDFPLTSA